VIKSPSAVSRNAPLSDAKNIARHIFHRTLAAIDIALTMRQKLARDGSRILFGNAIMDLAAYDRFLAIAVGKASVAMARGLTDLLAPEYAVRGILVAPHDSLAEVEGFRAIGAGHPIPDSGSFLAARAVLDLLAGCNERTLVFFLLSGGGSSLMELPLDLAIPLYDVQELNRQLVTCGAPIAEINAVRKHLSAVKGGRLATAASRATKLTLAVSDVPAGSESALASGPTLPDPTTVADACTVMDTYSLWPNLPDSIRTKFTHSAAITETPKPGDPSFAQAHFFLLLTAKDLLHHAHQAAEAHGYVTVCDNSTDDWPLGKAADYLLDQLDRLKQKNPGRPVSLIADGELSSPAGAGGIGGRNSAFVLECAARIAGKRIAVLSAGTDGKDGSSPAAGAVADGQTLERARAAHLDPAEFAERHDSYSFFKALGDAVETGPTGNNLRDFRILIAG
jgi:glycerate 2-kinase